LPFAGAIAFGATPAVKPRPYRTGGEMYDYVIVGAGSAGCTLAARLSEQADASVALIEAGGPDTAQEIHIPVAFGQQFRGRYDWDLWSEPEPGLEGRHVYMPRGKVLGGCSSMNAMIYIRGNRADYDAGCFHLVPTRVPARDARPREPAGAPRCRRRWRAVEPRPIPKALWGSVGSLQPRC
jgi:choline dehydrogenase-like flavoprotein